MFEGLRFRHWHTQLQDDRCLLLTLDRAGASTNALGAAVLDELLAIVERVAIEPPRGLIISSGKADSFIVGADIREFEGYVAQGSVADAIARGHRAFDALARLPCPTVAAIHGACLGGGLELALACRERVATRHPKTRLGLPEVLLGIHPGWGGSARLTHLIGAPQALDLMLTGRSVSAEKARTLGLVQATCDPERLLETARARITQPGVPWVQRARAALTRFWPVRQALAAAIRSKLVRKANPKHYPAPSALLELWRRHGGNLRRMLEAERKSVVRLSQSETAHNLVRVYFLQERLKGLGDRGAHGVRHVHVVGAGTMGGDIAAWCALQGFTVSLQDRELRWVEPALQRAHALFARKLKDADALAAAKSRLQGDVEGAFVPQADLLIEAIYENLEAKRALYAQVEPRLKPDALLATNTSSIPLARLREGLARPERFVGIHYFNPVALMPLVELVRHDALDAQVLQRAQGFVRALEKLPLPVAGSPGFLINRVLMPYLLEAITAYAEGIPAAAIDQAAKRFGMPMGPIELVDTIGLDVAASVGTLLAPVLGLDIPPGLEALLGSGKRGKKDGQGFYPWVDGKPQKPELPKGYQAPQDLCDRLILPLVIQAFACLREGVVEDADLVDAGIIFGTGFAPFRGGPIHYACALGAAEVQRRLQALQRQYGARFAAPDLEAYLSG